jgi:hypothetical protein
VFLLLERKAVTNTQPYFRSDDGRLTVYGEPWWAVQRTRADDRRCRRGNHTTVMWGWNDGSYIGRCSCAATQLERGGPWLRDKHPRYVSVWPHRLFWAGWYVCSIGAVYGLVLLWYAVLGNGVAAYAASITTGVVVGNAAAIVHRNLCPW